ncbi:hypothetical protein A6769_27335 [Nostoc punctiforme NIES-2108]|uniref:Uncharacterized protein n=1 Tax=Nostoc punctiforme NIES-2108 TaxID=1356359 RepID=A0A367RB10_NOSPU|nr:hypothetical protein A6769_27335 [Nostoc punctiforme NIES-2108]
MNEILRYNQFIYGKFAGNEDSGYCLVARTADLTNQEQLVTMVEKTHRFWKGQPPVRDNIKAAGIFLQDNNLVLVQASSSINANGHEVISGYRDFIQHRYVFIPIDSLAVLQSRTYKLLYWILNQIIPIQYEFNPNLAPLQIPLLEEQVSTEFRDKEVTKIQQYLSDRDTKIPWLLEAEDALIDCQRLLLTVDDTIKPEDFLEIILLLLPAVCHSQVSVAVGTLDEQQCNWAQVLIKFNNYLESRLPDDLIWLNRATKKNEGWFNQNQFKSHYLSLINSIVDTPIKISQLLEQLGEINSNRITLQNLTDPRVIAHLIPLLPDEQQDAERHRYLSKLSTEEWQTIIPIITDNDQQGLAFALRELSHTARDLQQCLPLIFDIWKRLSNEKQVCFLQTLKDNFPLAEILLNDGLTQQSAYQTEEVVQELIELSMLLVSHKSHQNQIQQAWEFAKNFLTNNEIFNTNTKRFNLLNAAFPDEIPANAEVLQDPDYPQIIIELIPALPDDVQDNMWRKYLSALDQNKWQTVIPKINIQGGLVVAWQKLEISTIQQPNQYTPLMLEVWKRLSLVEKTQHLQQLQQNVKLGEILLEYGLLEPSYLEGSDTAVMRELITLSKSVVALKSQDDWNSAWQFATHLAKKPIFQDKAECFCLLDTVLKSEIPIQNLYDFFKYKFANLLTHVESIKIQESNLYRQLLTKNAEAAELLNILLAKRNGAINVLPQLSNLVGMSNLQQDDLYYQFLTNWLPSYEEARNLLVALIKLDNFKLNQTLGWFENKKAGVFEILFNFQKSLNCWDDWHKLASILYNTPQESVNFIDKFLGEKFPIDTLQEWLPIIANDENIRKSFCINSRAWEVIQHQDLNKLVVKLPEYAVTLTRCLQDSHRFDWINGDLLRCLCENWISQGGIDSQLQTLVTSDSVTKEKEFSNQDWLQIQMAGWKLGIELKLPQNRPSLQDGEKRVLSDNALQVLENHTQLQQRQSLLYDCHAWCLGSTELKNIALRVVELYTHPQQTRDLLKNCETWKLSISEQKEILKAAPHQACSVDLMLQYLGHDGKLVNIEQELKLLEILLQIQQCNEVEIATLQAFYIDILTMLVSESNINRIKWWKETASQKQIYLEAFNLAIKDFARQMNFERLKGYSNKLKDYSLFDEANLLFKACLYWLPEATMKQALQDFNNLK